MEKYQDFVRKLKKQKNNKKETKKTTKKQTVMCSCWVNKKTSASGPVSKTLRF